MRSILRTMMRVLLFSLVALLPATVFGQDARLQFERLDGLESRARDVVEVNIEGKLLDMAKRVLAKGGDQKAQKVGEAINGLKGIYVRAYNFEHENEYNSSDIDAIRMQLQSPGWERLANVRSKRNNQKVDVYTMFAGDLMSGVAVVVSESKSVALINVIGPIDIELLAELSGNINIPRFEIQKDGEKPKN